MNVFHEIQHWIHTVPVAYVAWICTVIAVALAVLIGLRAAFRRRTNPGNRATRRVLLLVLALCLGVGLEALLDHGYRLHLGHAEAAVASVQTSQTLFATKPVNIEQYYAFQSNVGGNSQFLGSIPELTSEPIVWSTVNGGTSSTLRLIGIPTNLSPTFYAGRHVSKPLRRIVNMWETKLAALSEDHVYVNQAAAQRMDLRRNQVLAARVGTLDQFVTVSGILPGGDANISAPAMFMTLPNAQRLLAEPNQVSAADLFLDGVVSRSVHQALRSQEGVLGAIHLTKAGRSFSVFHLHPRPLDVSRRVAALGVLITFLACLVLLVLGRRSLTRPGNK